MFVICHFGGQCAGQILFEREGMDWDKGKVQAAGETNQRVKSNIIKIWNDNFGHIYTEDKTTATCLRASKSGVTTLIKDNKGIRKLTPLECCRLQGFPDDWCDGVEGSDTAQYKMWGNGVALPCVLYIMEGIARAGKEIGLD